MTRMKPRSRAKAGDAEERTLAREPNDFTQDYCRRFLTKVLGSGVENPLVTRTRVPGQFVKFPSNCGVPTGRSTDPERVNGSRLGVQDTSDADSSSKPRARDIEYSLWEHKQP